MQPKFEFNNYFISFQETFNRYFNDAITVFLEIIQQLCSYLDVRFQLIYLMFQLR